MILGLIGVAVWFVAQTLAALVVCAIVAVPFAVLYGFDALARARETVPPLLIVPPAPPRQPIVAPFPERAAA
jgi:hypothetical protein